jgi:hypothetical protein
MSLPARLGRISDSASAVRALSRRRIAVDARAGADGFITDGTFTFGMGSIPFFAAGQTYTLTRTLNTLAQPNSFNISEYTAPAPVPAPAAALLLAGGLLGLRALRRIPRRD